MGKPIKIRTPFGERVKKARTLAGLTQFSLAMAIGKTQSIISDAENTAESSSYTPQIAMACGVSAYWLATGEGPMISAPSNVGQDLGLVRTRRVPVVGAAKMGDGGYFDVIEDGGYVEAFSADPLAYALRVKGDSMHPAIRHGSIVVVEPSGRCVPSEYVAISLFDGQKMVKELIFDRQNEVVIESVNGQQRQTIEKSTIEQMHPIGSVVSASKWREA